jgi:hypothetical protein
MQSHPRAQPQCTSAPKGGSLCPGMLVPRHDIPADTGVVVGRMGKRAGGVNV